MKNIARWGLVALGLVAAPAWAEDLLTAYNQALQNDPTFKTAEASLQATRELLPISRSYLLPSISGSASTGRAHINQTSGDHSTAFDQKIRQYALNINQVLFDYRAWAGLKNANAQVKQGYANYNAAVQNLIVRVATAYFAVLQAHDQLVATQAQKRSLQEQLNQTQEQFKVGLIPITGVQQVKASYDATVAQEIANQATVADKLEELRAITNVFPTQLMGIQHNPPLVAPVPQDINAWADTATKQSYALKASYYEMVAAKENVGIQRGGHFPTVSATGSYSYTNQNQAANGSSASGIVLSPNFNHSVTVGVGVDVPIFSGGQVSAQTRQAAAQYAQASAQLEQTHRSTLTQTREAYLGVISGISKLKADQQAIVSNQSSLDSTKAGYQAGVNTITDVLQQQSNLYNAQTALANDQYNYLISLINLKQAAGTLAPEDVEVLNSWLSKPLDFSAYNFNDHPLSFAASSANNVGSEQKKAAVNQSVAQPVKSAAAASTSATVAAAPTVSSAPAKPVAPVATTSSANVAVNSVTPAPAVVSSTASVTSQTTTPAPSAMPGKVTSPVAASTISSQSTAPVKVTPPPAATSATPATSITTAPTTMPAAAKPNQTPTVAAAAPAPTASSTTSPSTKPAVPQAAAPAATTKPSTTPAPKQPVVATTMLV
jgi:outer membrane protein